MSLSSSPSLSLSLSLSWNSALKKCYARLAGKFEAKVLSVALLLSVGFGSIGNDLNPMIILKHMRAKSFPGQSRKEPYIMFKLSTKTFAPSPEGGGDESWQNFNAKY